MSASKSYLEEVEEALKVLQNAMEYAECRECWAEPKWYNTLSDEEANRYAPRMYVSVTSRRPTVHKPDCKVGKAMRVGT